MWITPQCVCALLVAGGDALPEPRFSELIQLELSPAPPAARQAAEGTPSGIPSVGVKPFGTKDTWRWNIHGGFGAQVKELENNHLGLLGGGLSYFVVQDLSLELEASLLYISQIGNDAVGGNLSLLARWHFHAEETWSLYVDFGSGLLGTTDEVPGPTNVFPEGAAQFNFTPQAGLGLSYEVAPETRLLVGLRWHHISNARTNETNPGRDSFLIYAGLSMPF